MGNRKSVLTVVGSNVFKDETGHIIIYRPKEDVAYLVGDKKNQFKIYQAKWLYAVIVGIVVGDMWSWGIGICAMTFFLLIIEYYYRHHFLPSLQTIQKPELPSATSMYERNMLSSFQANCFKAVTSFAAVVVLCLIVHRYMNLKTVMTEGNSPDLVITIGAIVVLIYGISMLVAALRACIALYIQGKA